VQFCLCCGPWLEGDFTNFEGVIYLASTNKTENLKLSQWEATDALSHEDLNRDHQIIDETVGRKSEFVLIKDVTMDAAGKSKLDVDVSDIDFTDWQYIFVDVVYISRPCKVMLNNESNWCYCGDLNSTGTGTGLWANAESGTRMVFMPCKADNGVTILSTTSSRICFGYGPLTYSAIKAVNFFLNSDYTFADTAEFKIWGIK